jgi:hypothetical protein
MAQVVGIKEDRQEQQQSPSGSQPAVNANFTCPAGEIREHEHKGQFGCTSAVREFSAIKGFHGHYRPRFLSNNKIALHISRR